MSTTMQKLTVAETKELVSAVAKLGTAAGKILADGSVDLKDALHVPLILSGLRDLTKVDFLALLPELKDLDDAERAELAEHFKATFDLPDDGIEKTIEQGLEIALMAAQALWSFVQVGKKVKAAV